MKQIVKGRAEDDLLVSNLKEYLEFLKAPKYTNMCTWTLEIVRSV